MVMLAAETPVLDVTASGALVEWAWLLVVAPFVAFVLIILVGKRLPLQGAEIGLAAVGFSSLYGIVLFLVNVTGGVLFTDSIEVAEVGSFVVEWGWLLDGLSTMMFVVVGVVSTLVHVYSLGYMRGDSRFTFFYAALSLFTGSMLLLVVAPNTLQMLVGWELVGLCSYLLIGHWWEVKENADSAVKAFLTTKTADIGFVLGVIVLAWAAGSFRISELLGAAEEGTLTTALAVTGAVLLFIGAMGKSAQFPFHTWLPDAMAGPTPVSALIHAATMVTAGIYMVARLFPLYEGLAAEARTFILVIGTITLLIAGLLAVVQDDIKRVLAYSTVSQLGYMAAALGAGGYTAALFHLWTHAFFKALLFLGAGVVIHAVHSNYMSEMGGLRKFLPTTFWTFVVGSLALAGIPPLSGFFSKDEILATFGAEGYQLVLAIGILGAFITAFYMSRAVFLTFFGSYKGQGEPQEAERVMTVPLVILAVGALAAGWANIAGLYTGFADWVTVRAVPIVEHHLESLDVTVAGSGFLAGLVGIGLGYLLYYRDAETQEDRDRFRIPVLWPFLERKYYLDDIYFYGIVRPIRDPIARATNWINDYVIDWIVNVSGYIAGAFARVIYRGFDQRGIDLVVNGVSFATGAAGGQLRFWQTGRVQQYLGAFIVGVLALVVVFVVVFAN
ncbi:MAG: NADH-quinone oxidoreductase subunit L [Acidimicrobiia bacterium]